MLFLFGVSIRRYAAFLVLLRRSREIPLSDMSGWMSL